MVTAEYQSPLGTLLLGEEDGRLCCLCLPGTPRPEGAKTGESEVLRQAAAWLDVYFAGRDPGPLPPRQLSGTPFQCRVWSALAAVPYGESRTYGELARQLHTAPRAVGGALNKNPLPIFLPCHRIIGADGSLTGFAGGLGIKEKLLKLEHIL